MFFAIFWGFTWRHTWCGRHSTMMLIVDGEVGFYWGSANSFLFLVCRAPYSTSSLLQSHISSHREFPVADRRTVQYFLSSDVIFMSYTSSLTWVGELRELVAYPNGVALPNNKYWTLGPLQQIRELCGCEWRALSSTWWWGNCDGGEVDVGGFPS